MNLIQKFRAKTPLRNKRIGRFITVVTGIITVVETTLHTYPNDTPEWLHKVFMISAVIGALWAAYHGAQVKK